jgi:hypothetical protein
MDNGCRTASDSERDKELPFSDEEFVYQSSILVPLATARGSVPRGYDSERDV